MKQPVPALNMQRRPNQWGFNSLVTEMDAVLVVQSLGLSGSRWYIWRLSDGTFDYSNSPNPVGPGHPAELVREIVC